MTKKSKTQNTIFKFYKTPKLLGVLFFLCSFLTLAQINGTARTTSNDAIAFATVILKKSTGQQMNRKPQQPQKQIELVKQLLNNPLNPLVT